MQVNIIVPVHMFAGKNNTNITKTVDTRHCSTILSDIDADLIYAAFISTSDVLCLGLITWAVVQSFYFVQAKAEGLEHL